MFLLKCVKDWVRKGPSLRYGFVNNSTSVPQMSYLISILFKSPSSNMTPPTFGITLSVVFGIGSLDTFAERRLLYRLPMALVLACRRDVVVA